MSGEDVSCIFCAIAAGREAAHIVYEDDDLVAFLDRGPIRPGHVQIIPREHYAYFDDLPPDLLMAISLAGQKLARAQKRAYGVERSAFLFTGGDVPHVHAHVVPMVEFTDITSRRYIVNEDIEFRARPRLPETEMASIAEELRSFLTE